MQKILLTLFIAFFLIIPLMTSAVEDTVPIAANKCSAEDGKFCLNVPIPGTSGQMEMSSALGDYIKAWYSFIIGSVGIIATVMIMIAGFKWLTSGGNSSKTGDAKDMIVSAIIGLVLAFLSYTILYIINPNLTIIHLPDLESKDVTTTKGQSISEQVEQSMEDNNREILGDLIDLDELKKNCPECEVTSIDLDPQEYAPSQRNEFAVRGNNELLEYIMNQGEIFTGVPSNYIPGCKSGQRCFQIDSGNILGNIENSYWYWQTDDQGGYWHVIVWE